MSSNIQQTKKPYCKVCFDAGKPESEYTSHWVRSLPDRSGKTNITCPTLLNTECRYCYKRGHTAKFCPALKKQNIEKAKAERKPSIVSKPKMEENRSVNPFAALDDSDSETNKKVSNKTNAPLTGCRAISEASDSEDDRAPKPKPLTGYAAMAAKQAPEPVKSDGLLLLTKNIKYSTRNEEAKPIVEVKPIVEAKPAPVKTAVLTKSWADWSDSEDEEDENEEQDW